MIFALKILINYFHWGGFETGSNILYANLAKSYSIFRSLFFFILSSFSVGLVVAIAADEDANFQVFHFAELKKECPVDLFLKSLKNFTIDRRSRLMKASLAV